LRERIFYAATGQPLRTANELADIVRARIATADIRIGPGLSDADKLEIRYRGVLSIDNARQCLRYQPRFLRLEDGVADYIEQYRHYRRECPL
jgi:nucleoside-diphosphate-sugar epimerase